MQAGSRVHFIKVNDSESETVDRIAFWRIRLTICCRLFWPIGAKAFRCIEHLLRVAGNRHFGPYPHDALIRPDQERGAYRSHEFSAVQRFLLPYAIFFEHLMSLVRCQGDGELVLGFEAVERRDGIRRYPENLGAGTGECGLQPGKVD